MKSLDDVECNQVAEFLAQHVFFHRSHLTRITQRFSIFLTASYGLFGTPSLYNVLCVTYPFDMATANILFHGRLPIELRI